MRFLSIYKQFPDGLAPAWPVAINPNTSLPPCPSLNQPIDPETAFQEQRSLGGRIDNSVTLLYAHLFNIRYRILLAELHHCLLLRQDVPEQNALRGRLIIWILSEMNGRSESSIMALAQQVMTGLDQYNFVGFKAGAPFEVPFTFDLPDRGQDRWRFHRDFYEGSRDLVKQLEAKLTAIGQPLPTLLNELTQFEDIDDQVGDVPAIGRIGIIDKYKNSDF